MLKTVWLKEAGKLEFSNIRGFLLPQLICSAASLREVATSGLFTPAGGIRGEESQQRARPLASVDHSLLSDA